MSISVTVGVYSLSTSKWLSGASVTFDSQSGTTDSSGTVDFTATPGTTYKITASYTGYKTESKDYIAPSEDAITYMYLSLDNVDIRAESISLDPSTINQGDTFDITVSYKNYGTNSGSQLKTIYSDTVGISEKIVYVSSGNTKSETYNFISGTCPQLCEGTHSIRVDTKSETLIIGSESTPGTVWFTANVMDITTLNPIYNATVKIGNMSKVTDADGKTDIFYLDAGTSYNVEISAKTYKTLTTDIKYSTPITVTKNFKLTKGTGNGTGNICDMVGLNETQCKWLTWGVIGIGALLVFSIIKKFLK